MLENCIEMDLKNFSCRRVFDPLFTHRCVVKFSRESSLMLIKDTSPEQRKRNAEVIRFVFLGSRY